MFFFFDNNIIPPDLLSDYSKQGDVSILIGENGSGKSHILRKLTQEYTKQRRKTIAISNSIHDKFPDKGNGLHLLRDRMGRRKAKYSVKNALLKIPSDDLIRFKNIAEALRLVGYDPVIGIENIRIDPHYFEMAANRDELSVEVMEEITSMLYTSQRYENHEIIWLTFSDLSFGEIKRADIIQLLKWEQLFKKLKLIKGIDIYLRKNNADIDLYSASSGELSFITSIFYASAIINENTVLLIDEPENSLHPKWQKEYVETLLNLFYKYQPKIVIATHSALVVTGAEVTNPSTVVYNCRNFTLSRKMEEPVNIEAAFMDYFNVVTPQNRYLSEILVSKLNLLAGKQITIDDLSSDIEKLRTESFDDKQKAVLDGVLQIANQMVEQQSSDNELS